MEYLSEFGFNEEEIKYFEENIPSLFRNTLEKEKALVRKNLTYLKELGVTNYKAIFTSYYDMFLIDSNSFSDIFNKYDKEDLIEKLEKNITIVEHL